MKVIEIEQNEVKSYIIPSSGVLYIAKEIIQTKNIMNITVFFSGGQNIKLSYTVDRGLEVYLDIRSQLDGIV